MAPTARRKDSGSEELRKVRDRELEIRRISGEISCADCRRLKLKCDKKIPCSSCVRRGTELLCPLGARGSTVTNSARGILAGPSSYTSQRDRRKLTLLTERIRALEDALALESEARGGSGSHPLLTEDYLAVRRIVDADNADDEHEDAEDHVLDEFGTLTIDESRTMRYLGPAASESALVMEILEGSADRLPITSSTSNDPAPEVVGLGRGFPFSPIFLSHDEETIFAQLLAYLPPFERATALYEAYFTNLAWFNMPIDRLQFVSEIIPIFYPRRKPVAPSHVRAEHAHDLALLYAVFASGAAGDMTQNSKNDEGEMYEKLAKAALSVKSILQGASLQGVQAVFLLATYDVHSGQKRSQEDAWKLVAFGSSLAAAIGLHRDPSRWGFNPNMVERRRKVFWEIYAIDVWKGLESGRPCIFRSSSIDCELPTDTCVTLSEDGESIESVMQWRHRFCRDIVADVCEKVTAARPLRYRDVLELDRRIRNFPSHPFATNKKQNTSNLGIDADFVKVYPLVSVWELEESLLYIHRNFFARAILDFPDNPMRSPFAVSFLATYRSAVTVLRICRENMERIYLITLRIWQIWSLCFACAVIVGSVASLGPSISFATSAFVELEYVITLFEKFNDHVIAKHGLPLLRKIREKAVAALSRPRSRSRQPETGDTLKEQKNLPIIRTAADNATKELLILHGTTRVVEQRSVTPTPSDSNASSLQFFDDSQRTDFLLEAPTAGSSSHSSSSSPRIDERPAASSSSQGVGINTTPASVSSGTYSDTSSNSMQSSAALGAFEADVWLTELEKLLGTGFPQSFDGATPIIQSQSSPPPPPPSTNWTTTDYPMKINDDFSSSATSTLNVPHIPLAPFHNVPPTTAPATADITPDMLLNETVSTGEWRQFMQQSGLSDTPPFDFAPDSFVPPANVDMDQGSWQGVPPTSG